MLSRIEKNTYSCNLDKVGLLREERERKEKAKREMEVRKTNVQTSWQPKVLSNQNKKEEELLREIMVKIDLKRIDIHEEIIVEALLDSRVMGLVMSSEFTKKQKFKLKKIDRPIYVRNVDGSFNKEGLIKHTVEVSIYY